MIFIMPIIAAFININNRYANIVNEHKAIFVFSFIIMFIAILVIAIIQEEHTKEEDANYVSFFITDEATSISSSRKAIKDEEVQKIISKFINKKGDDTNES